MTSDVVLTAAHVVKGYVVGDDEAISVRFFQPERKVAARFLWSEGDLAALHVGLEDEVETTRYGLVEPRGGKVACEALGFPSFKFREEWRDSFQLIGSIYPLSNIRTGTLQVSIDNPPAEDPFGTAWQGMSGAALFARKRLVGIIKEVHLEEGARHLTAQRADWDLTPEHRKKIGWHRPESVNKPPGRDLGAYAAQVRDLAPDGGLRDRDRELDELTSFCTGDETYLRWQGEPWSGKTALTSAFVLDPPPGVRVAAYFAVNRLGRQDDFLQVVGEQLAAIAEEPHSPGAFHHLLESAAERCRDNGERLVLVVDGLDEDPAIALQLPRILPANVGVLVTSRPNPGLHLRLRADHPLHRCRVRTLRSTPYAQHLELEARKELDWWLHVHRNDALLGLLAAARGGLTPEDLATLTGLSRYEIKDLLDSNIFGFATDTESYAFAHETLLRTAEQKLGGDLDGHRARIHEWADSYRAQGWPEDTPAYLLTSYRRLLTGARLVDHALDPARQGRMSRLIGGQAAALREIAAAQDVIRDQPEPGLGDLVRLAVARDRVGGAAPRWPDELLVLWVRLGQATHAESLARSIADPGEQADALAEVTRVLAQEGELVKAEALARTIHHPGRRAWATAGVAWELAGRGEPVAAEALADTIGEPERRAWALGMIARACRPASRRLLDRAEEVTRTAVDPRLQARTLAALVEAAVACGDLARAESLADRIPLADQRVRALSAIARQAAADDLDLARAVLRRAEATAEVIVGDGTQSWALATLVEVMARCGELPRARDLAEKAPTVYERFQVLKALAGGLVGDGDLERAIEVASSVPTSALRAQALAAVAEGIARRGDREWAVEVVEQAEVLARKQAARKEPARKQAARKQASQNWAERALVAVVRAFAVCGDPRAEEVVRSIGGHHQRSRALSAAGGAALDRGDVERARELAEEAEAQARSATSGAQRTRPLVALAEAVEDPALAETLACAIPEPAIRARMLVDLVKVIARQHPGQAEALARARLAGHDEQDRALAAVAESLAGRGEFDRAERLALSLPEDSRAQALTTLVGKLPDLDRAMAVVKKIPHADRRAQCWVGLIETVAARGSPARARRLLHQLRWSPDQRAQALVGLAKVAADQGRAGSAHELAGEAEELVRRLPASGRRTSLLMALVRLFIRLGHPGQARRLIGELPPGQDRAGALGDLAAAFALRGQVPRALRLLDEIRATGDRARAYVTLVKALADGGEPAEAASIARRHIPLADHLARAYTAVTRADPGGIVVPDVAERAESLLPGRVTNPDQQLSAFADLVKAIADGRGFDAAAPLAGKVAGMASAVEDPERRAQILIALSKGVVPGHARRLLAQVLAGPAWTAALGPLREADPQSFGVAVEVLTS
ncbi:hypothetical protein ACQEUU_02405 [Nonomuraea sp. CA-218870]|uniref:hypothetical protein n=1 Tax=Nonomuraea sp. CA-218870 TaxID=3239998 RepID=UPI003D9480A9